MAEPVHSPIQKSLQLHLSDTYRVLENECNSIANFVQDKCIEMCPSNESKG